MVDLVKNDEVCSAQPVELSVQFVERIARPKPSLREATGMVQEQVVDETANEYKQRLPATVHRVGPEIVGFRSCRHLRAEFVLGIAVL